MPSNLICRCLHDLRGEQSASNSIHLEQNKEDYPYLATSLKTGHLSKSYQLVCCIPIVGVVCTRWIEAKYTFTNVMVAISLHSLTMLTVQQNDNPHLEFNFFFFVPVRVKLTN